MSTSRERRLVRLRLVYRALMLQAEHGSDERKAECRQLARRVRVRMADLELAGDADIFDGVHSQFGADVHLGRWHG